MINSLNQKQNEPLQFSKGKKPKFEESITEKEKLRKRKSDEQPDTTDMPDLDKEKSASQNRN